MRRMMIFIKIVLIACLLVFIGGILMNDSESKKSVEDVEKAVLASVDAASMEKGQVRDVRRAFGINPEDYSGVIYYKPLSTMDVKEMLIVKLKSNEQAEAVEEAVNSRIDAQLQSFQGYGAAQCALLEAAVVKVQGNFVFYAVADNVSECKEIFLSSL